MFPVGDLNVVVCGIATFAATVGYACTRKFVFNPSHQITQMAPSDVSSELTPATTRSQLPEPETGMKEPQPVVARTDVFGTVPAPPAQVVPGSPVRRQALKRKRPHDDFEDYSDAGYPLNLLAIYPNKRSRTPSSESENDDATVENDDKSAQPTSTIAAVEPVANQLIESVIESPKPPQTPPPSSAKSQASVSNNASVPGPFATPLPVKFISTPRTPSPSRNTPSRGFAAFAGSASPFSTLATPNGAAKVDKAVWRADATSLSPNEGGIPSSDEKDAKDEVEEGEVKHSGHVLEAISPSKAAAFTHITGEEDEDVELELKGVKLFINRGGKGFSDGMVGHVKLLSNKTTLNERLLFRREPLWQAMMNVRLHPALRCTLDAEDNVLRVSLKEQSQVVVYALKPGRFCSKKDFREFADSLMASSHLKSS